jgi:hypothetical protein
LSDVELNVSQGWKQPFGGFEGLLDVLDLDEFIGIHEATSS